MNVFWSYFWPVAATGLLAGVIAGTIGFRRQRLATALSLGAAGAIIAALIWHGPLGAADRFAAVIERTARQTLVDWEMGSVVAHLHREPLTRHLVLIGRADDFQRSELARIMSALPGVGSAGWTDRLGGLPLAAEAALAALLSFLVGVLLAYLVELHRRYNAQWSW